ncbi:MAG: glycosyltransferase family 2 protein, partial [Flavobacteriales bacterium]|nr:glycosyltransferase family 2 protein [Flavobacteriales bacterium]
GLLFNYRHFYGSYDYVGASKRWYKREVRVVRNDKNIYSFRDAQGFQKEDRPLRVKPVEATIHHYGWVKDPRIMQRKQEEFNKLWHDDKWVAKNIPKASEFDYSEIDSLMRFDGKHPIVMQDRIARVNWKFDHDLTLNTLSVKDRLKKTLEKLGIEAGYKNYKII